MWVVEGGCEKECGGMCRCECNTDVANKCVTLDSVREKGPYVAQRTSHL